MFCPACGSSNDEGARFCGACGGSLAAEGGTATATAAQTMRGTPPARRPATAVVPGAKNPTIALILSIIIPGVGQFYNGETKKGAVMLGALFVIGVVTLGAGWLVMAAWSGWDAYGVAKGTGKRW
jgi:TM2 domain-containing membrane protein YozV